MYLYRFRFFGSVFSSRSHSTSGFGVPEKKKCLWIRALVYACGSKMRRNIPSTSAWSANVAPTGTVLSTHKRLNVGESSHPVILESVSLRWVSSVRRQSYEISAQLGVYV